MSKINILSNFDDQSQTDEMYNSLRRLSQSTNMATTRLRKISPSPIPYTDVSKELTCTLNESFYTNGKPISDQDSRCEVQETIGTKREVYKKRIKSIGTSLKNCVISDMISIDIDPESTRLPLMCKLMIIVEGAAVERGTRVLVRDASIQCETDFSLNDKSKPSQTSDTNDEKRELFQRERSVPIIRVCDNENAQQRSVTNQNRNSSTHREVFSFSSTSRNKAPLLDGKYRSSESINYDQYNKLVESGNYLRKRNIAQRCLFEERGKRNRIHTNVNGGGSLINLRSSSTSNICSLPVTFYTNIVDQQNHGTINQTRIHPQSYFNRNRKYRLLNESYLDLTNENSHFSTPYYQYQRKNLDNKQDFSHNTTMSSSEYYLSKINRHLLNSNDHVELHIPIYVESKNKATNNHIKRAVHRNEKYIVVNNDQNNDRFQSELVDIEDEKKFYDLDYLRSLRERMRSYIDERMNRFEAEITFFNLNTNQNQNNKVVRILKPSTTHTFNFNEENQTLRRTHRRVTNENDLYVISEPSVTNLMLMQVVDGHLIE